MSKFERFIVVAVTLFVAVFALGIVNVYAQGTEPPLPDLQPSPLFVEFGALMGVLLLYAVQGVGLLAMLKPLFLNRLKEEWEEKQPNLYLSTIYIVRFLGGGLTMAAWGGIAVIYRTAPSLQAIPLADGIRDVAVYISLMLILGTGQEGIYIIWNMGRSLIGQPPMGSIEPQRTNSGAA